MASTHSLRKPASISSLPLETLIMIFGFLDTRRVNPSKPYGSEFIIDFGTRDREPSEGRFPYPLISVCTLWKEAIISNPQFRTQLSVALDASHKSFKNFGSHLQWSRNLPFEVLLTSLHNRPIGMDEKYHLSIALETLSPHLHRCKRLSIQLLQSSSLPPVPKIADFLSGCRSLDILELDCVLHDNCVGVCPGTSHPAISSITWRLPPLLELSLSGDSVFLYTKLFDPSPFRTMRHLTLANYDTLVCPAGVPGLTNSSLIRVLRETRVEWITLENLSFALEEFESEVEPLDGPGPTILQCKDLQEDIISAVYKLYQNHSIDKVSITSTGLNFLDRFLGDNLFLEKIFWMQSLNLFEVIKDWSGRKLWVYKCTSVDDALLKAMTKKSAGEPYACPGITVSALKRLVKFRWEEARKEFEWQDEQEMKEHSFEQVSPIIHLEVDGQLSAHFLEKDVAWFESKLHLVRHPFSRVDTDEDTDSDDEKDSDTDDDSDSDEDSDSDDNSNSDDDSDTDNSDDRGSDEDGDSDEEEENDDGSQGAVNELAFVAFLVAYFWHWQGV